MPLPACPLPVPGFHLRPLRASDAPAWHACVTDPRVSGPTSWPACTLPEIEALVARYAASQTRWAIARASDDVLVGTCGATRWEGEAGVAEVAYELAPEVWGRGLAAAAVRAFLAEAAAAGLHTVEAHTWVGNAPSARVLERCGFARVAHLPAFRAARGEWRDFWRWSVGVGGATGR